MGRAYGKPLNIIMVDDDIEDALLTEAAIKAAGQAVSFHHVTSGKQLFDLLDRQHEEIGDCESYPVVLLDLNMPEMDGSEVLKRLRGHGSFNRIPVIVVSTSSAESDVARCYEYGANAFVTKPASFEKMVDTMEAIGHFWGKTVRLPG